MDADEDSVNAKDVAVDAVEVLEELAFFTDVDKVTGNAAAAEGPAVEESDIRSTSSAKDCISPFEVFEREIDADDL